MLCCPYPCKLSGKLERCWQPSSSWLLINDDALHDCRGHSRPSFQSAVQAWQAKHDDAALLAVADRLVADHHDQSATAEETCNDEQVSAPARTLLYMHCGEIGCLVAYKGGHASGPSMSSSG